MPRCATICSHTIRLSRSESNQINEEGLRLWHGKSHIDNVLAECVQHLLRVNEQVRFGFINVFDPDIRIRVCSVLSQAAQRAHETRILWILRIRPVKDASSMVDPIAELALDCGIVDEVVRAAPTDTPCSIQPIFIHILPEYELRTPPLLHPNGRRLSRENTMQTCEV